MCGKGYFIVADPMDLTTLAGAVTAAIASKGSEDVARSADEMTGTWAWGVLVSFQIFFTVKSRKVFGSSPDGKGVQYAGSPILKQIRRCMTDKGTVFVCQPRFFRIQLGWKRPKRPLAMGHGSVEASHL